MLIQFKCSNHRSIKDEITFSMVASNDNSLDENLISLDGLHNKYLRCAEIYGANGSGKTTVINAIWRMKAIVLNSNNHQPGDTIPRSPHKLSQSDTPTTFNIIFVKDNVKYSYGFSYTDSSVIEEYLYFWNENEQECIFEREGNADFEFSEKYRKDGENCRGRLKDNKLLLSCSANETKIEQITDVFLFFRDDLVVYPGEPNNWFEYSINQLQNNAEIKNTFLSFMNSIGSDIVGIQAKIEQKQLNQNEMPVFINGLIPVSLQQLKLQKIDIVNLKLDYGKFSVDINEESSGVQKLFKFLCPIIDILHNGKIFICDEIETHLHPSIVAEIVKRFAVNKGSNSQIVLTTHDTDLLNLDFIRKDQVWFSELNTKYRSTDLYSLAEFKNVYKGENFKKGYILGRYGAIPLLSNNLKGINR